MCPPEEKKVQRKPLQQDAKGHTEGKLIIPRNAKLQNTGPLFDLTRISIIPRSFIHCRAKQAAKYGNPTLDAIRLIPRSFIYCRAKWKSILDVGSRSNWHISVGELTFGVGESTSYVGELVVGETAGIRWELLRTLIGGQLPQVQGNLLIFDIWFATNPHLVPGWGGGGVYIDSCIKRQGV